MVFLLFFLLYLPPPRLSNGARFLSPLRPPEPLRRAVIRILCILYTGLRKTQTFVFISRTFLPLSSHFRGRLAEKMVAVVKIFVKITKTA